MFQLSAKKVIITGAGSGIGKAIAKLFASQGATVFLFDINQTGVAETVSEIRAAGGRAQYKLVDIADQPQVKQAVGEMVSETGRIDILVNNAGVAHVGTAVSTVEEDFDRLYRINVKGVYNCLHAVIPYMLQNQGGVILNMCSIAASVGITDRFAYSMTKGAVLAMTLSTARDYLAYNIRCNCVSPARIYTPFVEGFIAANYPGKEKEVFDKLSKSQPIGRMGTAEEAASLCLYLCSEEAGFITGCDYPLDGGFIKLNN